MNPQAAINDRQQVLLLGNVQLNAGVDAEGKPLPPIEGLAGETWELYVGEASLLVGSHLAELVGEVIPGDVHTKTPATKVEAPPPPPEADAARQGHGHHKKHQSE